MRMFRLNTVEGKLRNKISLTTNETANDVIALRDDVTLELIMDGNTCIAASADARLQMGGGVEAIPTPADAKAATAEEIADAAEREIQSLAAALYPYLSEDAKEKAAGGL